MKILQVVASPLWGGQERVCVELANELSAHCDVSFMSPGDAPYLARVTPAVRVLALPEGSRRHPWTHYRLRRAIHEMRPDIVHSHGSRAAEMVHWATLFSRVRHVATKHNTRRAPVFSLIRRVTAVSEQARGSIALASGVEVIHNGLSAGRRAPPEPSTVERPERFTIAAIGRLHHYKGFDQLLRAVTELDFDVQVRIAGEGPARAKLTRLTHELGIDDRVLLLGHVEDVRPVLGGAHLMVVPSRTEGFSLALIEGLHHAPVILSTPVGVAPEILPHELLTDGGSFADRIRDIHERYEYFETAFASARSEHLNRFTVEVAAERYLELYRRMLNRSRSHRDYG